MTNDEIEDIYELSPLQQGMLFHAIYEPDSSAYFEQTSAPFYGELNVRAFTRAWEEILDRHTILRTSFHWEHIDKPVQIVHRTAQISIDYEDWQHLTHVSQARRLARYLENDRDCKFDFSRAPLMRLGLIRLAEDEFQVIWSFHHIVLDGWSYQVVENELWSLYEAFSEERDLKLESVRPYGDYIAWLQQQDLSKAEAFWRRTLRGFAAPTSFSSSYRRIIGEESVQREREYGAHELQLEGTCSAALKNIARQHHLTLNTLIQGAWAVLLSRYCGESDVVFGVVVSGRPATLRGVESMVGLFINTLPMRTQVSQHWFLVPWLKSLQAQQLETRKYEYSPMLEIQRWSDLPPRVALFDSIVVFENFPAGNAAEVSTLGEPHELKTGDSDLAEDVTDPPLPEGTNYPLCLLATPDKELQFRFYYQQRVLSAATIEQISGHLHTLLNSIASNPDQRLSELPLLTESEQYQLLNTWNTTAKSFPRDRGVVEMFEAQVAATPDKNAFICDGEALTYKELNARANRVAHHLRALGVGSEILVGVCLERSLDFAVVLLGILKAGGAYLPLDPSYPPERLTFMLQDSRALLLVTRRRFAGMLSSVQIQTVWFDHDHDAIESQSSDNVVHVTRPEHLAYVIYTSGSTGRPKGVAVEHEQILNRFAWMWDTYPFESNEVCCQKTALNFVDSIWELLGPLLRGVTTVIVPDDALKDADHLVNTLSSHAVTRIWVVPSLLQLLLDTRSDLQDQLPALKFWVSSGEALSGRLLERFREAMPNGTLYNLYGTSEVWDATWYDPRACEEKLMRVPIGRPIDNVQTYILDCLQRLVPIGVPGELYVGGVGLARGYINLPELTKDKFVSHPFGNGRLYRTGDLARYLPDGEIELLGRTDQQIKIRGFRVELDEVESSINQFPGVQQALVVQRENGAGNQGLLAYIVPNGSTARSHDDLRATAERISQWREIWDETYAQSPLGSDGGDDFAGWVSSYTSTPLPADEMREYVEHLTNTLLEFNPSAVLDIGCGTGLLLFRAGPLVNRYCATDFSGEALRRIDRRLAINPIPQVAVSKNAADDFTGLGFSNFDMIVLNSVVQYFPNTDYLLRVIENAFNALNRGGRIFIGDVRNLLLLECFHSSVELHRAAPAVPLAELKYRVQRRVGEDEQLAINPAFFLGLQRRFPRIRQVQIRPKRGRYRSEVTRFRYDVILRIDEAAGDVFEQPWMDWQEKQASVSLIRQMLLLMPEHLGFRRIRCARFAVEQRTYAKLMMESNLATVGEFRGAITNSCGQSALDLEELWSIQSELPYTAQVNWSGPEAPDCYDVLFTRIGSPATRIDVASPSRLLEPAAPSAKQHSRNSNNPMDGRIRSNLVQDLRGFLGQRMPQYMVPAAFLIVESFPLTPNGKIDRGALPEPELTYSALEKPYFAPRTRTEEALARIWQEVLAITHLGIDDNFFELGGHSLTATRLLSRLRDFFQIELPLRSIFDHPTIAAFSQFIDNAKGSPVNAKPSAIRALDRQAYSATVDSAGKLDEEERWIR